LDPKRIIFLIQALLLERKLILIQDNFGENAIMMESLVSLLNPFKWNFVFITYLTPKLVDCLEAPFPYLIGVSRKIWEEYCSLRELQDDVIILDLDNNKILKYKENMPDLPYPYGDILQRNLYKHISDKEEFSQIYLKQQQHNKKDKK